MHHLILYISNLVSKSKIFSGYFFQVILRVKRPSNHIKVHLTPEKRPATANPSNKVKWRDDFDHYDNDSK